MDAKVSRSLFSGGSSPDTQPPTRLLGTTSASVGIRLSRDATTGFSRLRVSRRSRSVGTSLERLAAPNSVVLNEAYGRSPPTVSPTTSLSSSPARKGWKCAINNARVKKVPSPQITHTKTHKPFHVLKIPPMAKGIHFNKVLEQVCVYTQEETPLSILVAERYNVLSSSPASSVSSLSSNSLSSLNSRSVAASDECVASVNPIAARERSTSSQKALESSAEVSQLDQSTEAFSIVDKPPLHEPFTSTSSGTGKNYPHVQKLRQKNHQISSSTNPTHTKNRMQFQPWHILSKTTPSGFSQHVLSTEKTPIALESVYIAQGASDANTAVLLVTVLVRNWAFKKRVQCCFTTDAWRSGNLHWTEGDGVFVTSLDGGLVDRFRIEMKVDHAHDTANEVSKARKDAGWLNADIVTVEFAVQCVFGEGEQQYEVWDNRGGSNHVVVLERGNGPTGLTPQSGHFLDGNLGAEMEHGKEALEFDTAQRDWIKKRAAAVAAKVAQVAAVEAQKIDQEFQENWRRRRRSSPAAAAGSTNLVNGNGGGTDFSAWNTDASQTVPPRSVTLRKPASNLYAESIAGSADSSFGASPDANIHSDSAVAISSTPVNVRGSDCVVSGTFEFPFSTSPIF
ncbi:hypothetical protein BJ741DRAFT_598814 [Chytriomyces cf. hyalinus JEL632]|nr:hypothetical protein BJ741DRAFT_598814 [Chytriomyces cf. hyalinus JEL632]